MKNDESDENLIQLKKTFVKDLSNEISFTLQKNAVIMATSLVASIILVNRKDGISEEILVKKVNWLYNEILARNGIMSMNR